MLDRKKHYLQVALNSTLVEARHIIAALPVSDRIILEAGTPLIKQFGTAAITELKAAWQRKAFTTSLTSQSVQVRHTRLPRQQASSFTNPLLSLAMKMGEAVQTILPTLPSPYIVADLKCMDRGETEAELAANAGASAAVVLGSAPTETINRFILACRKLGIDSMVDMMAIDQPIQVMRKLRQLPNVVILHRGVDETSDNKTRMLPIQQINKVKGSYNVLIAVAGGDTTREIQSAVFNGADIVVVWKDFYHASAETAELATSFLQNIK